MVGNKNTVATLCGLLI